MNPRGNLRVRRAFMRKGEEKWKLFHVETSGFSLKSIFVSH